MADLVITIPEPTAGTLGLRIEMARLPNGTARIEIKHPNPVVPVITWEGPDIPAAVGTAALNFVNAALAVAKPLMGF